MWRNLNEKSWENQILEVGNRSDEDMEVDSDPEDVPLASLQTTQRPATPVGLNHNGPDTAKPLDFCFLGCVPPTIFFMLLLQTKQICTRVKRSHAQ